MQKWKLILLNIFLCMLPFSSVSANSPKDTNADPANWDKPVQFSLTAKNIEGRLIVTKAVIQWNSDQIKQFQSDDFAKQFFPSLVFKTDKSDHLMPVMMVTNLPGAKFFRSPAGEDTGEEIKVTVLNTSRVIPDKEYVFYTAWLNYSDGNPVISLQSLKGYAQPNGTLNDIPSTDDYLSAVDLIQSETLDRKFRSLRLPDRYNNPVLLNSSKEDAKIKTKSYSLINSKEALERYKINTAEKNKFLWDYQKVNFAITFKDPGMGGNTFLKFAERYDLEISQIYAAGKPIVNGKTDKDEEYTVSWFDTSSEQIMLLIHVFDDIKFGEFGIAELEGTARVEELKRIKTDIPEAGFPNADFIEMVEDGNELPTGVHWLNSRYADTK